MSTDNGADEQARLLLELVRQLEAELHSGRPYSLTIDLDANLERDLGLDSLARVELLGRIEKKFGVRLAEAVLAQAETVRDLLNCLKGATSSSAPAPLPLPAEGGQQGEEATVGEAVHATTLVDLLSWHERHHGAQLHLNIYGEGELRERITFAGLSHRATEVAAGLQAMGIGAGQSVALMLPSGADYFVSFFGVLLAGGVPVPLYPPARLSQIEEHLGRHVTILNNCQATLLITIPEVRPLTRLLQAQAPGLGAVQTVAQLKGPAGELQPRPLKASDTALLQYTSGSTGDPKGVVLTHANLLANIRAMGQAIDASPKDVFVSWLPLYHDMGLIGAWLGSLYYGCQLVIMSPLAFLVRPESWLWAIHHHRGTLSAAPNFGYELCLKRIEEEEISGLDLSSWRLAFNGAEPVSPATVEDFPARFKGYGFKAAAMAPVYGLAESAVGLAFPTPGEPPAIDRIQRQPFMETGQALPAPEDEKGCLRFVACGRVLAGHEIRIVDQNDQVLAERQEGRLQFRGPSATSGYLRDSEKTRELFHGSWLDSGDLAYLAEGEVYISSRSKDIIIHGGRNIYPSELEEAVGCISGVRKGCVAVFGSRSEKSSTEKLIVVAETRAQAAEELQQLTKEINATVTDLVGMPPDQLLLMPPHTILKTSSGKLRRSATRALFEEGRLGGRGRAVWYQLARVAGAGLLPQLGRGLSWLLARLYGAYCWALYLLLALLTALPVLLLPRPAWRRSVARQAAKILAILSGTPIKVQGREFLQQHRSMVLVANHASYLDAMLISAALDVDFTFVAKAELWDNPLLGPLLSRLEVEQVRRDDVAQEIAASRRFLSPEKKRRSLLIFAEGTTQRLPGLLPFHLGAFVSAAKAGLPLVPVTIRGSRKKMAAGSWLPRVGGVTVIVAPPLIPTGDGWQAAVELRDRARAEILARGGEPDLADVRPPQRGRKKENKESSDG
ncbi:MAG: AMP-binding protein [Thermodesulfobacteriota bacterium]